ncbi:hypothetical protein [Paenibacillus sp. NEAU-GSW1]|uniref:hypothetical protein n=1 Tax=Paenibacillus sp. NEAU-GSW1 TaxID=2682486 RepID=UPI0012E26C85|nr:hypothetical protein [Paenibacillus sp. NEAU-GSW1]MUT67740.1 hypothetical protein [Paenibacillus sp. NEAU-GSW1]
MSQHRRWEWVYSTFYISIYFLIVGRLLPNTTHSDSSEGLGGFVFITLLIRIPQLITYIKTAKAEGHKAAWKKILKIEWIAFLFGLGFSLLFSLVIIFVK